MHNSVLCDAPAVQSDLSHVVYVSDIELKAEGFQTLQSLRLFDSVARADLVIPEKVWGSFG